MLKHYVEFFFPGLIFSEVTTREVADRDRPPADIPHGASSYRFFDQEEVEVDGQVLKGEPRNYSDLVELDQYIYEL